MFSCANCQHWRYLYPARAGVCTIGPVDPLDPVEPAREDNVGELLAIEHFGGTATTGDNLCDAWDAEELEEPEDD